MMKFGYLGGMHGISGARRALPESIEIVEIGESAEALREAAQHQEMVALIDASLCVPLSHALIGNAKGLRVISCAATGSDHIESEALAAHGISVLTLRDEKQFLKDLTPTAELTWGLVLACARRLPAAIDDVLCGNWRRDRFPGMVLKDKQLGLIGCGRLGRWVARYGLAFGMTVTAYDPHADALPEGVRPQGLEDLMRSSDVISVHVHLSPETEGLVSRDLLAEVKTGAILINTSRGRVLDEDAVVDALQRGALGAVGLDVLVGEPNVAAHPLIEHATKNRNIVITPHIGGFAPEALDRACELAARKALDCVLG